MLQRDADGRQPPFPRARALARTVSRHAVCIGLGFAFAACGGATPGRTDGDRVAGADRPAATAEMAWFTDQAAESALQFTYRNGMSGHFYFPEMLPAGVALLDYDNDGDLDVYFPQGEPIVSGNADARPPAEGEAAGGRAEGRLFRNDLMVSGDGKRTLHFTDVTTASHITARGYGMGAAAADIDNDGCVDLFLTYVGASQLWRNNCDGTFADISRSSHTDEAGWSVSASFLDYDRDGFLDLYVGNYVRWDATADQACTGLTGRRDYCTPAIYRPQGDRLYHNNGNRTFTDVTATALKTGPYGPALGVSTADFDGDGWIDLYVANDGRENVLWLNQRDGTFKNTGLLSGTALGNDGRPKGSMGVDAGDFDNDGDEDLFTTQLPTEGNSFYVNDGHGLFEDRSAATGLGAWSRGYTGFGTGWFDYDNDSNLDLLVVNGAIEAIRERLAEPFPYGESKLLFHNRGNLTFEQVTAPAGSALSIREVSRGAAFGDLDNDGDTDVIVANINSPARLLINTRGNRAHWVGLRLIGTRGRRDMLGARVEVVRGDGTSVWRRARADGSYASANDPRVLVGLGEAARPVRARVTWPDGTAEEFTDVGIDRWVAIVQGGGVTRK